MSLSIVLPIHNEDKSLLHVVKNWSEFLNNENIDHEFLLCEDGSTDNTKLVIKKIVSIYNAVDLSSDHRRGYGGGVLCGIEKASKQFILCIDSDGQCMPDSFKEVYKYRNKFDIVIGKRTPRKDPFIRIIYSKLFLFYFNLIFKNKLNDPSCPYVLARKNIFANSEKYLSFLREGFWWGFVASGIKQNYKFKEIDIKHYPRFDGSTVVYKPLKMPSIIIRNIIGLMKLKLAK